MNLWTQLAAFSFIETEHSFLRPILFGDAKSLYKIASNPDNTEFIFPTESSLQESEYVIRKRMKWLVPLNFRKWMR